MNRRQLAAPDQLQPMTGINQPGSRGSILHFPKITTTQMREEERGSQKKKKKYIMPGMITPHKTGVKKGEDGHQLQKEEIAGKIETGKNLAKKTENKEIRDSEDNPATCKMTKEDLKEGRPGTGNGTVRKAKKQEKPDGNMKMI